MPRVPFRSEAVTVRPPATSANLGPGFDALGLALAWYDDVTLAVADGGLDVAVSGEGADGVARDEHHLVVRAARAAFDVLGGQPPGLRLRCRNRIPHARGMGSSSAAIVGGVVAARALVDGGDRVLDDAAVLALATALEGHPDNVAACLLGGLTIAWTADGADTGPGGHAPGRAPADGDAAGGDAVPEGTGRAVRLEPVAGLAPVLCVPDMRGLTSVARGLLPATVPHADAAANAGRAALLVHALTLDPALLLPATRDRLHQAYREPAMPDSVALVDALRARGVPAVVSGAGPTVLAFGSAEEVAGTAPATFAVHAVAVDRRGTRASVVDP